MLYINTFSNICWYCALVLSHFFLLMCIKHSYFCFCMSNITHLFHKKKSRQHHANTYCFYQIDKYCQHKDYYHNDRVTPGYMRYVFDAPIINNTYSDCYQNRC